MLDSTIAFDFKSDGESNAHAPSVLCRACPMRTRRGDIPTIKIGRLLRVPARALEEMLNAASRQQQ
jgi:hypothetical protein